MKPIEELRAQRALIQNHLEWLDDQIRQAELAEQPDRSTESAHPSFEAFTRKEDSPEQALDQTLQPSADLVTESAAETQFIQSSSASDIKTVQIGCFVLFAASTLLFLFLLFGLPYLLD